MSDTHIFLSCTTLQYAALQCIILHCPELIQAVLHYVVKKQIAYAVCGVCCLPCAISCPLSVQCVMPVACCRLGIAYHMSSTVSCVLSTVYAVCFVCCISRAVCVVSAISRLLSTVSCLCCLVCAVSTKCCLYYVCCVLFTVCCVLCLLDTVYSLRYIVRCLCCLT
jgi:hypothetical protein